jgi:hypothetical protein
MRALIVLSLTAIIFSSTVAEAGMSTGPHKVLGPTHTAPAARHVAANRPRESRPIHMAQAQPPAILAPIGAVGHAIGNTLGGLLGR